MPRKIVPPAQPDPDAENNRRVLAERQKRMDAGKGTAPAPAPPRPESTAETAVEFLADEFDRKNFGDPIPTIERIVYGPDPLLDDPAFKERIERFGVQEMAEFAAKAIIEKGAMSQSSPILQAGLAKAIRKFGVEKTADAFYQRVMKIPVRIVQIEMERDDELLGEPLREAVKKYGSPGFAPKFLADNCIAQLGLRGYRIVHNEKGDPVKVGTLIMAEIPQRIADQRRKAAADESIQAVKESEATYQDAIERAVVASGAKGAGSGPLYTGESFTANASEDEAALGQRRAAGISFETVTD